MDWRAEGRDGRERSGGAGEPRYWGLRRGHRRSGHRRGNTVLTGRNIRLNVRNTILQRSWGYQMLEFY